MVVTRSSTRSHGVSKDTIKASTTSRKSVTSSWHPGARSTRQAQSDAVTREAAEEDQPQPLPAIRYTPPRRSARRQSQAKSVASIATGPERDPENDEVFGDDDEPENDEELRNDEESEAADGQEEVDLGLAQLLEIDRRESRSSRLGDASLNPEVMIQLRGNLYKATQDLYNHLCSARRDGTWDFLLDCFRNIFNQWKANYTIHGTPFLDRDLISNALSEQPQDAAGVSHVISAANLVTLMDAIHRVGDQIEDALDIFREVDDNFPYSIMAPESARIEAYEKYDTFHRALDIRISRWILEMAINEASTKDAAMSIGSMLLFGKSPEEVVYPKKIDWEKVAFKPIYGDRFDDYENEDPKKREMRREMFQAFEGVSVFITDNKVDLTAIEKRYPLGESRDELSSWAKNLFGEVVDTIEKESARPATNPSASKTPGDSRRLQSGQSLHRGKSSVQFLASAKKKRPAPATEEDISSRKSPRGERSSSDSFRTPPEDSGDSEEDRARSSRGSTRSETANDNICEFRGDSREENRAHRQVSRTAVSPPRKKPIGRKSRARQAQRPDNAPRASAPRETRPESSKSPASGEREPPTSSAATMRQPQRRAFWAKEDERTLRELVAVHGSFWAHMEEKAREEELFLVSRTQQQIRDKARNMKVDYLKDDRRLPQGFDHVVLGKKEKDRLIGLGKNPERMEAEVEDGRPVNTDWIGDEGEEEEEEEEE